MNNKVSKSGDTMTGKPIFTNGNVANKRSQYDWNDTPAPDTYSATSEFLDKNGERMGVWEFAKNKDGTNSMNVVIKHGTGKGWDAIRLYSKSDGNAWVTVPRSNVNGSVCITDSRGAGFMRFGNGLQFCWGNSPNNKTITLPQAFINNTYRVTFCQTENSSHTYNNTAVDKTTTSFKFVNGYTGDWIAIGWWY